MSYEAAINRAWEALAKLSSPKVTSVRFLADEYAVDIETKKILSLSRNAAAGDFVAVLILHYAAQKIKGLPALSGRWLTFKELSGVEGYEAAFRERALRPIIRKYGNNPQGLHVALERLPGRITNGADAAIEIEAFSGVPVLVKLWKQDEEFGAEANMFFDQSISKIFCTEDIVVLAGFVAAGI
jgi:hypothetical protein